MVTQAHKTGQQPIYTVEEFMSLPDDGKRYELVNGVVEEMSQPGGQHGRVTDNLYAAHSAFVRANKIGRLLPVTGFHLNLNADRDTVRAPDLAFLGIAKLDAIGTGAITIPPDLAIEVVSPHDRPGQINRKLVEYRQAGWDLVWIVDPDKQSVEIYRLTAGAQPERVLVTGDILDGNDILPGFSVAVEEIFA